MTLNTTTIRSTITQTALELEEEMKMRLILPKRNWKMKKERNKLKVQ